MATFVWFAVPALSGRWLITDSRYVERSIEREVDGFVTDANVKRSEIDDMNTPRTLRAIFSHLVPGPGSTRLL